MCWQNKHFNIIIFKTSSLLLYVRFVWPFISFFIFFLLNSSPFTTSKSNNHPFRRTLFTQTLSISTRRISNQGTSKQKKTNFSISKFNVILYRLSSSLMVSKLQIPKTHLHISTPHMYKIAPNIHTFHTVLKKKINLLFNQPQGIKEILLWWMSWFICRRRCFQVLEWTKIGSYTFEAG